MEATLQQPPWEYQAPMDHPLGHNTPWQGRRQVITLPQGNLLHPLLLGIQTMHHPPTVLDQNQVHPPSLRNNNNMALQTSGYLAVAITLSNHASFYISHLLNKSAAYVYVLDSVIHHVLLISLLKSVGATMG